MKEEIKGTCFYQGKWFDSIDDMIEYAKQWSDSVADDDSKRMALKKMTDDLLLNIHLYDKTFSNREFSEYVYKVFLEAMRILHAR